MEITGRLVADATIRAVSGDKNVTGFSIAINRRYWLQPSASNIKKISNTSFKTEALEIFGNL